MPTTHKFMHFHTRGLVLLFDGKKASAAKKLAAALDRHAKGTEFRDPDPAIAGKSALEFMSMVADGTIGLRESTKDAGSIDFRLRYETSAFPATLALRNPKMFMVPPALSVKLDGNVLLVDVDLRIELKGMLRPAELAPFVDAVRGDGFKGVTWQYRSAKKFDSAGDAVEVFEQPASAFDVTFFDAKKALLAE